MIQMVTLRVGGCGVGKVSLNCRRHWDRGCRSDGRLRISLCEEGLLVINLIAPIDLTHLRQISEPYRLTRERIRTHLAEKQAMDPGPSARLGLQNNSR